MDQSYIEELIILIIVGSILLIAKIIACCLSLGLHHKHKAINLRQDSLSIAKLNHLQLGRISEEKPQELVTSNCNCPKSPQRNLAVETQISPKLEIVSPSSDIPEKTLVSVRFHSADTQTCWLEMKQWMWENADYTSLWENADYTSLHRPMLSIELPWSWHWWEWVFSENNSPLVSIFLTKHKISPWITVWYHT